MKHIKKLSKQEIKKVLPKYPYHVLGKEKWYYISGCFSSREFLESQIYGRCTSCGALVYEDGEAIGGCRYSPVSCEICGYQKCDGSC